jgi:hypothetical protein
MKASHIISIVSLCMAGMALVCAAAQWSGGVDRMLYTNTLGWSLIACGVSFVSWPHGYKQKEKDMLPPPISLSRHRDSGGRKA